MADQTIDSLNLQISASTQQAISSINKLLTSLKGVNISLKSISSSGIRTYSKEIGRMAATFNSLNNIKTTGVDEVLRKLETLSKLDLSKLNGQQVKIGVDIDTTLGNETKNLEYSIQKTIDEIDVNADKLSEKLAKSFNIKGSAKKALTNQVREISKDIAATFNGENVTPPSTTNSSIEKIKDIIWENGSQIESKLNGTFGEVEQAYQELLDYFNNHKITMTPDIKSAVKYNEYLKDGFLRNFVNSGGINLSDFASGNGNEGLLYNLNIKDALDNAYSDAAKLNIIIDKIKEARETLKSINFSDLGETDDTFDMAEHSVYGEISDLYDSIAKTATESLKSNMQGANGMLPVDVNVNQDKIVRDIRNAINKVAELKYNAVKVNLNVDTQSIKDSITQKLSEIDSGQLTGAADSMEKLSNSMQSMGSINYKDNGLNAIVNSLGRLAKTDMSAFDTGKFSSLMTSLSELSNIPDVSNNINRFVNAIAKLASAGNNVSLSANALPKLGANLKKVTTSLSKTSEVSSSMNNFVSSISKLASAGNRTGQTAEQLTQLGEGLKNFVNSLQDAPEISENILRMTEALGNLASSGTKASTFFNGFGKSSSSGGFGNTSKIAGVTSSIKQLATGVLQLSGSGARGLSNVITKLKSLGSSSNSIQTATFNLKNLFATIVGYRGISGILNSITGFFSSSLEGKGILEIGSDIAEIENVVDVSFGSMADKAYEFAESATESYGLSELAAKEYSGTMMAMLKSSGLGNTKEMKAQAAEMSTTLAGLAGDMASFFNIDTDTAFYKIRAGISGKQNLAPRYRNVA